MRRIAHACRKKSNLLIPGSLFLKADTWPKCCMVLGPIIMQNINKNSQQRFRENVKKPNFLTLNPLLIPGLFFLKPDTWPKCCTVLGPIIMQNIKKNHSSISEKMSKNPIFGHLIPCNPGLRFFFKEFLRPVLRFNHSGASCKKLDKSLEQLLTILLINRLREQFFKTRPTGRGVQQ